MTTDTNTPPRPVSKFTPENISTLEDNEVFVFGSNVAGVHGAGAAKLAYEKFGAVWGRGSGHHGKTYAIPTKDHRISTLPLTIISVHIIRFIRYAAECPSSKFLVTKIGCGLAGYSVKQIAPLFKSCKDLSNVTLPEEFHQFI